MASFSARICRRSRSDPNGSEAAPRRDDALLTEFFVVQDRMTDKAGCERGAVGERFGGREVITEAENQAVSAVIGSGAEETGHDDASGDGAADFGVGAAGKREIEVVHDERARRGGGEESRHEVRGVARRDFQDSVELGVGDVARGLEAFVDLGGEVLRKCDGGQAVQGAFPRAADGAAGDNETEAGVESDVDAAHDAVGF